MRNRSLTSDLSSAHQSEAKAKLIQFSIKSPIQNFSLELNQYSQKLNFRLINFYSLFENPNRTAKNPLIP